MRRVSLMVSARKVAAVAATSRAMTTSTPIMSSRISTINTTCSFSVALGGARRQYSTKTNNDDFDEEEEAFTFDATANLTKDAMMAGREGVIQTQMDSWLPDSCGAETFEVARKYLTANPIDEAIATDQIRITHVEDDSNGGREQQIKLPIQTREDAIKSARDQNKQLIQMFEKDGVAFCRIRDEKKRLLKHCGLVDADGAAVSAGGADNTGAAAGSGASAALASLPKRLGKIQVHDFRDAVDAHFIGWKSKAIVEKDLEKGRPVKLAISRFASPHAALEKMKMMMSSIKATAEANDSIHAFSGMHISASEFSISLTPRVNDEKGAKMTALRHPSPNEWNKAEERFMKACGGADREHAGTYRESKTLKPKNVGARTFRTDKYGRRIG